MNHYSQFDKDLREGQAREDAFVHVLLRSRVEHKRDKKAWKTGNIALEIAQKNRNGDYVESGCMVTKADRFAIEYAPECWLMLPKEYVQKIARFGVRKDLHQWIGNGGNHLNVLAPIEWFVRPPLELREFQMSEMENAA